MANERDDPEWQLARAEFLFPDSDNRDERMSLRILAATRMRDIEARYEQAYGSVGSPRLT